MATWTWVDNYSAGGDNAQPALGTYNFSVKYTSSAQGSDQMTWQRNFTYEMQPIAGAAAPYLYEGMAQPAQMVLSGMLLAQSDFQSMLSYYLLERTTTMTDDRGVIRVIFPTEFVVTRLPSALFTFKSSYQLTTFVFSTTFP